MHFQYKHARIQRGGRGQGVRTPPEKSQSYRDSFVDRLCCLCLVFVMLSRLIVAALWSTAGWGGGSELLGHFGDVYCDFVTFPLGVLGQVWYLIVSIPDPCCLSTKPD